METMEQINKHKQTNEQQHKSKDFQPESYSKKKASYHL
eukprot:CAMPEP_0203723912 /NCGR_PEP_ID=MMETSP0092-20131115/6726_1 /ASSEMBLY_ACC=CAM_ASM_001090 /TAXON_ID=426623 /ORGANISM="Chaetoceros affinis, Strain CCMP159" /LENGTH=37 /DNA_ID= /DNA_START= /DNA_END= /DNA_ORIENTATION=